MKEISEQIKNEKISHVILQAGVGGMAAAMIAGIARHLNHVPKIIIVEPEYAACVMESIKKGKIEKINIEKESILGGMSCGEVSLVPWEILKNSVDYCVSVPDDKISDTVKALANSKFSENKIVGGECSTPGIISLISLCNNEKTKIAIKAFFRFISFIKYLKYLKIYIKKIINPSKPNLFNTCNAID